MKTLLLTLTTFLCFGVFSQTPSPWIDEMTSIGQPGDKFRLFTGQPNTGSHNGEMCFNVAGNYLDEEYYSFESEGLDLLLWAEVSVEFTIESNLRNNDQFAFYYYDGATSSWSGFDLSNLTGTYTVTIPTSTTSISFDLSTLNSNGGLNGKYAHIDRIVLSDPASPLPVELLYFEGEKQGTTNVLNWSTASENNSDYYDIEFSRDAYTWYSLGTLPAAGNSTMTLDYSFTDVTPLSTINYYRLVQYDWDGNFEVYGPIVIDNRKEEKRIVKYVSLSGQEINPTSTTGLVIVIYEDGTTTKVYLQ